MNPDEFRKIISGALEFTADHDFIVTIGIKPNRPETGYGYVKTVQTVQKGTVLFCTVGQNRTVPFCPILVEEFKEKPDLATAKKYLADGNYLWNAGIFVWNINTITDSIRAYKPNLAEQMDRMVQKGTVPFCTILEIFPQCEKISIDYAVMEPAAAQGKVYTYPADFGWSDLGNWQSLHEKLSKDAQNNAAVGNVDFHECSNCVVHTEGLKRVVLQGLDGYIVSEKGGQLLVCRRSEEQRIKEFSA